MLTSQKQIVNKVDNVVFLARHCSTDWARNKRLKGKQDILLSEGGKEQVYENALNLKKYGFDRIINSSFLCAKQSAQIYSDILEIFVIVANDLKELDHGDWEGNFITMLKKQNYLRFANWIKNPKKIPIPGGTETIHEVQKRAIDTLLLFTEDFRGKKLLLITHQHICVLILCALYNKALTYFSEMIYPSKQPICIPLNLKEVD